MTTPVNTNVVPVLSVSTVDHPTLLSVIPCADASNLGKAFIAEAQSQNQLAATPDATEHTVGSPISKFLNAMWRSEEGAHFIGIRDPKTGVFRNQYVSDVATAIEQANEYSSKGFDVYFACAEFKTTENRKESNVAGACAFWVDVDCGDDKAAAGKGYRTIEDAEQALNAFCATAHIPLPTHTVSSGGGLHLYWALTERLDAQLWKAMAAKLKALAKAQGFLADPSRTADIASVMRFPGTNNYKTGEARPVTLKASNDQYIDREEMLDAIDAAMVTMPVAVNAPVAKAPVTKLVREPAPMAPEPFEDDIDRDPPNLKALASALKTLSPDCDEKTWKFHRLAPMAYESRYFPVLHDPLYKLAKDWSSGDLGGIPSIKWNNPGGNGLSGKQSFDRVWKRFLADTYTGKRASLGTLYWCAKQTGWDFPHDDDDFIVEKEVP